MAIQHVCSQMPLVLPFMMSFIQPTLPMSMLLDKLLIRFVMNFTPANKESQARKMKKERISRKHFTPANKESQARKVKKEKISRKLKVKNIKRLDINRF